MYIKAFLFLWFVNYSAAQDPGCGYVQEVVPGNRYAINSPRYPQNYLPDVQCAWTAICPPGYNCRINCSDIAIPQSPSCSLDRLLVSYSGDPQLNDAQSYCNPTTTLNAVSTGQRLSVGLTSDSNSRGGKFYCEVNAQLASTPPPPPPPTPTCSCGIRRQDRIVGGQETGINEFPMMAGIVYIEISEIKCGSVIISSYYVLSAAYCVAGRTPNSMLVVVGEHNYNLGDSPATTAYPVARIIIHPQYNAATYDYDVALIRVNRVIAFSDRVLPVCLPFKFQNTDFTGSRLTLLGWGTSPALQKVEVDVISQTRCRSLFSTLTDRQLCTLTPGKDACQDDSGGPSLYTDPDTGLLFSAGIISAGRFCGSSSDPSIHTRVNSVINWIVSNSPDSDFCRK